MEIPVNDRDREIDLQSPVCQEYLRICAAQMKPEPDLEEQLNLFNILEYEIKKSPAKLAGFRALKEQIMSNAAFRDNLDSKFVDAIFMLNLGDS